MSDSTEGRQDQRTPGQPIAEGEPGDSGASGEGAASALARLQTQARQPWCVTGPAGEDPAPGLGP